MQSSGASDGTVDGRLRQQEVIAELGQQALETDDLDQLMHDASVAVAETLGTEYAKVLELQPDGEAVFLRQGVGWRDGLVGAATVPTDRDSQAGYTLLTEEPIIVDDLRTEERFSGPELLTNHDVVSGISVIVGSVEDPWGVLGTHATDRREFTEHDANFVQSVANVLASAISNVRAHRDRERHQRQLATLIDNVPGMVYRCRNEKGWPMEFVSDACRELTGYEPAAVERGDVVWGEDVMLQADRQNVWETVQRHASDGETFSETYPIETASGERRWVDDYGRCIVESGDVVAVEGIISDVTERKRLEGEFDELLGRITDAFLALDTEWEFTHANDRAKELLDVEDDELVGENAWEVLPEATGQRFQEEARRAMHEQETVSFDEYYSVPLEAWFEGRIYPSETGLSVYFRDVTDRKEREQALQETKNETQALFDALPVGVFVAEADGRIVRWNEIAEELWGGEVVESESVAEYDAYEGWWVDTGEPVEPEEWPLARALDGEAVTDADEIEIEGVDGERRTVLFQGMPVRDADGEVARAVVTLVDISERKAYQEQLEESNERLEQFAYATSHDLQEPLRMVSSYLRLIDQRYGDVLDEDGEEFLEFAVDGAERMRRMIQGLLEYSRIESAGSAFEPVDLNDVVADVRTDLQLRIEESGTELTVGELPRVEGDEGQLRQLFQNLFDNAIEYSGDEPPRVQVEAERSGAEWILRVADDGIGIDPEQSSRVFQVFQRLHSHEEYDGAGIGLALCDRIVERHGGDIWIDSEPGEGATFSFTLPGAAPPAP